MLGGTLLAQPGSRYEKRPSAPATEHLTSCSYSGIRGIAKATGLFTHLPVNDAVPVPPLLRALLAQFLAYSADSRRPAVLFVGAEGGVSGAPVLSTYSK